MPTTIPSAITAVATAESRSRFAAAALPSKLAGAVFPKGAVLLTLLRSRLAAPKFMLQ
jgi:hypothetical protein